MQERFEKCNANVTGTAKGRARGLRFSLTFLGTTFAVETTRMRVLDYTRGTPILLPAREACSTNAYLFFSPRVEYFLASYKLQGSSAPLPFGTTPIPQGWKGQKHRRLVQGAQQPHAHLSSLAVHISVLSPFVRSQQAVRRTRKTAARSATTAARVTSVSPMAARRLSLGYLWSLSTRDACRRC